MGRQMPTECEHGRIIDGGDFDAALQECPECLPTYAGSNDVMAALADYDYSTGDETERQAITYIVMRALARGGYEVTKR